MLRFEEAQAKLFAHVPRLPAERVPLDGAAGRVLAEAVTADRDFPAFDHSAMDGYAVAARDFAGSGPWTLPVVGESRAGGTPPPLAPASMCRIFTGAALPAGADAVIMQEDVERDGDGGAAGRARVAKAPRPGDFVRRRGDDLAAGACAIATGTRLRAAHLGLAAAADRAWLIVAARPRVTVIGTGDELRDPGTPPRPGSIAESNSIALRAMAERAGASCVIAPFVRDDRDATARAFDGALATSDLVVSIGGVSVGDHDVVREALDQAGVELDFWRVAMKPGKPLAVGRRGRTVVLGLPGNPASAMVTFALFGVPLLRAMQGDADPFPVPTRARSAVAIDRQPGRTEFVRAVVRSDPSGPTVTPLKNQASGALTAMADANALLVLAADVAHVDAGADVEVHRLEDLGA